MANHLIIGLGGTGGKVLREMRKRVYEEFRSNEPGGNVNLGYLWVDSDPKDLNNRSDWKVMGKSVHLGESQKVTINGIGGSIFNNLQMYPGVASFINQEESKVMLDRLGPLITTGIGGQRRRLGRTLLANNLANTSGGNDFNTRLKQAVGTLQRASEQSQVTFHVCAGLAGGTGSGTLVDVISQIRKEYAPQPGANGDQYKVYVYVYVPEINIADPACNSGFYQANGYAALSELNAMSVGAYRPFDITGKKDNFTQQVQRLLGGINAFEVCYVYTNINEAGKILNISKGLPKSVADFLFQKIVAADLMGNGGKMGRLESSENDGAGAEYDRANRPTRSRKFMAFGIKRIEYPEQEIEECVTYNFAKQAALQLQYNHWREGIGYGEISQEEVGTGYKAFIEKKENRTGMLLSNAHLTLSIPIIAHDGTRHWKDLEDTWQSRAMALADDTMTSVDKKSWLAAFNADIDDYFEKKFRSAGVKKFYDTQRSEKKAYAKVIRRKIEEDLYNEWLSGSKSAQEVKKFISLLIANCEERVKEFQKQINNQQDDMEDAQQKILEANERWKNINWLTEPLTKSATKILMAYKDAKAEFYVAATMQEAYRYAAELLGTVIEELSNMLDGVKRFDEMMTSVLQEVTLQANSKLKDGDGTDAEMTVKKYNPELVNNFIKTSIADNKSQSDNARSIRTKLTAELGADGERSFTRLYEESLKQSPVETILEVCSASAREAMNDAAAADSLNRLVGVNILEKLSQEYNTDEKLEQFVKSLVDSAKTFVQFNDEEKNKTFDNAGGQVMNMIQIAIPRYDDDRMGFRKKLIDMFATAYPGFDPTKDVSENYKDNQIVIVSAYSGLPLRYITNVKVLKDRYDDMLAAPDKELNKLVLHTETFHEPLPELFEMDSRQMAEMMKEPLLLAFALGLVQDKTDPTTGRSFKVIATGKNDFGATFEEIGKDFFSSLQIVANNPKLADNIKKSVDTEFGKATRSNDQKAEVRQKLVKLVQNDILNSDVCEGNEFSPVYLQMRDLCLKLFESKLKDL